MTDEPVGFRRGQVLYDRGLYQAAVEEWLRLLPTVSDPELKVRVRNVITASYLELGFWPQADEASATALAECETLPRQHPHQISVRFNRRMYLAYVGRFAEAELLTEELDELLRSGGHPQEFLALVAHQKLGVALETGAFERVTELLREKLDVFGSLGNRYRYALLSNLAILDMYGGHWAAAENRLWEARKLLDHQIPMRERLALTTEFARLALLRGDLDRLGTWLAECGRLVAEEPAQADVLELGRLAALLGIGLCRSGNASDGERLRAKGLDVLKSWRRTFEAEALEQLPVAQEGGAMRLSARLAFLKRLLLALPLLDQRPEPAALYVERVGGLLYSGLEVERAAQVAAWADYLPEHAALLEGKEPLPEVRAAKLLRSYSRDLLSGLGYRKALINLLTEEGFDGRMSQRFITLHVA